MANYTSPFSATLSGSTPIVDVQYIFAGGTIGDVIAPKMLTHGNSCLSISHQRS
jgi:hypothetical protein